jgi:hypothetical protein
VDAAIEDVAVTLGCLGSPTRLVSFNHDDAGAGLGGGCAGGEAGQS